MIILDTNILWPFSPDSSSADLLRAIRAAGAHEVAVPWMVMEELAAQQAIKYREKLQKAAEALESLQQVTPWELGVDFGDPAEDSLRDHWRRQWGAVLETIPTSNEALREAAFREMNKLAPCKEVKGVKTGARDAAIWLSVVEYARCHPEETVYFVSANTRDFSDGRSYPSPMCDDIAGMESRFVHLTSMDDIASQFTEPAETDEALVVTILTSPEVLAQIAKTTVNLVSTYGPISCTTRGRLNSRPLLSTAATWSPAKAILRSVAGIHTYRIGDHRWCTAEVRWLVGGYANLLKWLDPDDAAGFTWTTSVLFIPDAAEPRLTVLRDTPPRPLGDEEFEALELPDLRPGEPPTPLEQTVERYVQDPARSGWPGRHLGIPRAYEGAADRNALKGSDVPPGG
ncbi:PIN domain-containing protein [Streptomyces sp. NPDC127197]|uniref:PIN domain-containing protein n=1 Tax=Streptomyces sp. NPDC127197 TaxID=3345388 RepID=UPI0036278361